MMVELHFMKQRTLVHRLKSWIYWPLHQAAGMLFYSEIVRDTHLLVHIAVTLPTFIAYEYSSIGAQLPLLR